MNNDQWMYVGHVASGEPFFIEQDINVWSYPWSSIDNGECGTVDVKEPRSGDEYVFTVWFIQPLPSARKIVFAAGEFSNGIFGFYRPKSNNALGCRQ